MPVSAQSGGLVAAVADGSPAARAGVRAGERIVAADGAPLADIIDWQWYAADTEVALTIADETGDLRDVLLVRAADEPWGIEWTATLFDGVRTCRNSCAFCFMTQLPKGLRPALYLRDDDFRLSFLHGNFVTLTNLDDADVTRISEQHLSPLYVSLHAVDPDVRARLVCAREDRALERFDELLDAGVDLHVQIVLVPGVNDGERLDETLTWLAEREGVVSVGVVPLGYTRHQQTFTASFTDQLAAASVIEQVQRWQFAMRARDGVTWAHLADEFYLNARAPLPRTEWYDDYPQYENGIGIVRAFVDEATELHTELSAAALALPQTESVTVVTSTMAATTLAGALEAAGAIGRVRLLVVPNRFFGGNVSVTGLLTGSDIAEAISADSARVSSAYLVPDIIFNSDGLTLDDLSAEEIVKRCDADVSFCGSDAAGLLEGVQRAAG
jgi:putative radical SAM enzyme (TIGR03279 family)